MHAAARPGRTPSRSLRVAALAAVVTLLLLVAGCGAGSQSDSGATSSEATVAEERDLTAPEDEAGGEEAGSDSEGAAADGANRTAVRTRAVIRTGEISLVVKDMTAARDRVDGTLSRHGGYIATEQTSNDDRGRPEQSMLQLRIPEPVFDTVMKELGEVGKVRSTDRSSEDVTTEVIDIDARVATQEASIERLQRFLRRATDIGDMIRLESEIATRQAELESMKGQQKYLADQTAMSTITLHMHTPALAPEPEDEETGFLAGLADGWDALKTVLVGAATAAGVLLPFAVTLAVLGVPVWLLVRTAVRRRRPSPPVATPVDAG